MDATFSVIIVTTLIVAVCAKWAVKLVNWLWFKPRELEKILRQQGLNGTPYRPFLGDVKNMMRLNEADKRKTINLSDDTSPHVFGYYYQIIAKYGKNSFMWFGPWPRLNIADPELIKEILSRPDAFQQPLPETGKILTGGIVFLQDEKWAKHRKIINPAFHIDKLKTMVPLIGLSCSSILQKWKAIVSSSNEGWNEIDVWPDLQDLTGDVISRTAFGSSNEEGKRIFQLQRDKTELTLDIFQLTMIPGWRYLPTKLNRRLKAMNNELQLLLKGIVDKRQKAMERGEAMPNDLLGALMESNSRFINEDNNGDKNFVGMSIGDVIDECKFFYFAGSKTTASLLVWAMVLLCQNPDWQTRAREEVNRVFGNEEPSFESLTHLKTVTMILQESLRLYPPAPLMTRGSTKTLKLGNMTIPPGVHMTLLIGILHRDPDFWGDDANEFNPHRFSEGVSNAASTQSAYIPFGAGQRVCIGQNLVLIEAKIALAMILQSFSFELSPSYLHAPFNDINLLPIYGAPMILRSL
ncbi:hypothetical protein ABFX02_08G192825 [Erythranthe guttata]